jgi:hypothetical protein
MADSASIKGELRSVYRDFNIDGVPASGDHHPDKPGIRAVLSGLVDFVEEVGGEASAGRRVFATVAKRDAWTDRAVGAQAYVVATGLYYRWDGSWIAFDDPTIAAADRASEAALVVEGVAAPAVEASVKIDDLWAGRATRALTDSDALAATGQDLWGTGHFIWGVTKAVTETGQVKALRTRIQDLAGSAVTIRAEVYRLPDGLTAFPLPVDLSAYVKVSTTDTPAVNLLGSRRIAADQIGVDIPLGGQVEPAGRKLLIVVSALNAANARVQLNFARDVLGGSEAAWLRGLYSDSDTGAPVYQTPPAGFRAWGQIVTETAASIPTVVLSAVASVIERQRAAINVRWQAPAAWRASDGFRELALAFSTPRPVRAKAIAPIVFDLNLADTIRYRIYRRPMAVALSAAPGTDSRDELLVTAAVPVATVATDPTSAGAQPMSLPFDHLTDPAWRYLVNWTATNAGALVGIGLAIGDNAVTGNGADTNLVWYALGGNQRTLAPIAGQRAAWSLIEAAASAEVGLPPATPMVRALDTTMRRAGRTLALPGCELARMGGALVIPPQTVTISDIAADTLTETRTVEAFNGNTVWASRKYLSSLTVVSAAVFPDTFANYTFANTNDGWSVTGGTLTPAADGSVFSETTADAYVGRTLSFLGSRYTRVIVELTRTANPSSGGFDGTLFYTTSGHGYSASHRKTIAANPALNVRTTLTFDMAALTAGGADWTSSTITAIRLDLDANGGGAFKIHSVKIVGGRLSAGTDYGANMKTGLVQLFGGTAPYDVSLTVTGFRTRYDLVWADPVTGEIGVAEGVARGRDPEEYLPALPSGKVALWHVHVTPGAMELLPVHRFRNMVEIGREAEFQAIREHNLRCLPGLAKRMRTGAAFGLLGYGDSQTEIADGAEPEQQLVANTGRDGLRYLQGAIPSDTIAANVARFNEDGTPNASGPIIQIGWSYALEAAIEARSACAVSYFNLGIGGTTASSTLVNGLYNGGHPDRLAAAIATGAKLAVIAFGMNQLGDPAIFSQTVAIVTALRAAGMECIILTVPGTNVFGPSGDQAAIDKWQATNDHLVRAALASDTAYVPFHMITGVGQEAALGISRESFSAANAVNHDGPYVMKKLGAFLAMMVTP